MVRWYQQPTPGHITSIKGTAMDNGNLWQVGVRFTDSGHPVIFEEAVRIPLDFLFGFNPERVIDPVDPTNGVWMVEVPDGLNQSLVDTMEMTGVDPVELSILGITIEVVLP